MKISFRNGFIKKKLITEGKRCKPVMLENLKNKILEDAVTTSSILRHFLVMAKHLDDQEVHDWVLAELHGYKSNKEVLVLPAYRKFDVESFGYFSCV